MEDASTMARPSKPTGTSTALRGWSNLSSEMGGIILSRMPSLDDRVRFRSVCRQWRHAAKQQWRLLPPTLPLLTTSYKCVFVGFPDGARHSLPVHVHARFWEAFDRWILCRVGGGGGDGDGHLLLRNPMFPDDTSLVLPSAEIHRIVVCPGGELVAAVGYIEGHRTLAFCRPGARRWSLARCPKVLLDIALHRGVLYALYDHATLFAYDLGNGDLPVRSVRRCIVGDGRPKTEAEAEARFSMFWAKKHYLVPSPSCGGRLLLVRSTQRGGSFEVFEATDVGDTGGRWSEVASLADDEALFVGANGSRGLQMASRYGGDVRGNHIYFAGESVRLGNGDNPASLGMYDMSSKTILDIGLPRGSFADDFTPTSYKCVVVRFPDGARHSLPVHVHARFWEAFDRWILCRVGGCGGDGDGHLLLRNPMFPDDTSLVLPSAEIHRIVVCPGGELVAAVG